MKIIVREIINIFFIFILFALFVHFNAWINHPLKHLKALPDSSLGVWHPIFLTLILYFISLLIRWIVSFIKSFIK